jgi:DNA-binding transcriptional MerR regulator
MKYYSIGEFANISQTSIDTLRYYEKENLIVVNRDTAGRRRYTEEDVQWILFIRRLKETGMPIKEIRCYAILRYQGDSTLNERLQMLEHHRHFVLAEKSKWESNLAHLEEKIKIYQGRISSQ